MTQPGFCDVVIDVYISAPIVVVSRIRADINTYSSKSFQSAWRTETISRRVESSSPTPSLDVREQSKVTLWLREDNVIQ